MKEARPRKTNIGRSLLGVKSYTKIRTDQYRVQRWFLGSEGRGNSRTRVRVHRLLVFRWTDAEDRTMYSLVTRVTKTVLNTRLAKTINLSVLTTRTHTHSHIHTR